MNCDAIAKHYAWMEFVVFGRALERCRTRFLKELEGTRRALVLGDGDGRFLLQLLKSSPEMRADYVDRSQEMAGYRFDIGPATIVLIFYRTDALREALPSGNTTSSRLTISSSDCFEREQLGASN